MVFFCGFLHPVTSTAAISRQQPMLILQHRPLNEPVRRISATRGTNMETKGATSIIELDTAVLLK